LAAGEQSLVKVSRLPPCRHSVHARTAYFSDRGRLFQADRGRQNGVAEAALGKRAGTGLNVAESSTISLKLSVAGRVSGVVLSPT
jgi:hypothetical protein